MKPYLTNKEILLHIKAMGGLCKIGAKQVSCLGAINSFINITRFINITPCPLIDSCSAISISEKLKSVENALKEIEDMEAKLKYLEELQ